MLDPKFVAANVSLIQDVCKRRGIAFDCDKFLSVYDSYRQALFLYETLKCEQGKFTDRVKRDRDQEAVEASKSLKTQLLDIQKDVHSLKSQLDESLLLVPNLLHPDVPDGGESDAFVVKIVGDCLQTGSDHLDICKDLDLLDFDSASECSGYGFCYLKNQAVFLELALVRYALDLVCSKGSFIPVKTPELVRGKYISGAGFSPRGNESQVFCIEDEDLCLIGTSEITIAGLLSGMVYDFGALPLRYVGISNCFRREAGAHGRACRGLFRLRQFTKVEMFSVVDPQMSDSELDFLVSIQEEFISSLGLSYRMCNIAAGDLGAPAYKKVDFEVWMPSRKAYGEVSSASNCTEFQARRLSIKINKESKRHFAHTLNGTAVAIPRIILAIVENFYDPVAKCISIPNVLVPYTGFSTIVRD